MAVAGVLELSNSAPLLFVLLANLPDFTRITLGSIAGRLSLRLSFAFFDSLAKKFAKEVQGVLLDFPVVASLWLSIFLARPALVLGRVGIEPLFPKPIENVDLEPEGEGFEFVLEEGFEIDLSGCIETFFADVEAELGESMSTSRRAVQRPKIDTPLSQ